MQFGRFEVTEATTRSLLPGEWTEELTKVLSKAYSEQSLKDERFFDIYGEIYEKEFVVIVSYVHHTDQMKSPISLSLSHDIVEDSKKFKLVLKNLIDLVGEVFDDIFNSDDWYEFNPQWTENSYRKSTFHYKVTRENVSLSLQADQLIREDK